MLREVSLHLIEQFERVLRCDDDPARRNDAITILQRWQHHDMLEDAVQQRARTLVCEFAAVPDVS